MKIVFVSHSFYSPYFVVGSHHLARQLARRGHTVWHISPIPLFHLFKPRHDYRERARRFFAGVVDIEPNLKEAVIRPLLPWQVTRFFLKSDNYFVKMSDIEVLVRSHPELQDVDILIVDEPRLNGIQHYIHPRSIYYRPTDLYADLKDDKSIQDAETALLSGCKGVIATSEPVLQRMLTLCGNIPSLILPNGVDAAFSLPQDEPAALRGIPRPRAVYVGAFEQRLDIAVIRYLVGKFPNVSFVIIGDGFRQEEIRAIPGKNVYLLGLVPHAKLSAYLQHSDVGLLPLVQIRSNEGRSPMKLYEYGMSGLPVLATHTPEMGRRKEDFIQLYSSQEEAARRLEAMLAAPSDRSVVVAQCAKHSWAIKATMLEDFINKTKDLPA
jgi:glycosyltransferase involved in cell wall biosynthesis